MSDTDTGSDDTTEQVHTVAKLASDIRIATLTTYDGNGRLVSRPMAQQEVEFLGTVISFAKSRISGQPYDGGDRAIVTL